MWVNIEEERGRSRASFCFLPFASLSLPLCCPRSYVLFSSILSLSLSLQELSTSFVPVGSSSSTASSSSSSISISSSQLPLPASTTPQRSRSTSRVGDNVVFDPKEIEYRNRYENSVMVIWARCCFCPCFCIAHTLFFCAMLVFMARYDETSSDVVSTLHSSLVNSSLVLFLVGSICFMITWLMYSFLHRSVNCLRFC